MLKKVALYLEVKKRGCYIKASQQSNQSSGSISSLFIDIGVFFFEIRVNILICMTGSWLLLCM